MFSEANTLIMNANLSPHFRRGACFPFAHPDLAERTGTPRRPVVDLGSKMRRGCLSFLALLWVGFSSMQAAETGKRGFGSSVSAAPDAVADTNQVVYTASGITMEGLDDVQKLAVGDSVIFRVVEDQELAKVLSVTDAGKLDIPELGLVSALGKTCKQLSAEIKRQLEESTYIRATVIMGIHLLNRTMSGRRVHVAGEVLRQGPQDMPAGETWTVSKAILNAGGFTDFADGRKVKVVRSGSKDVPAKTLVLNISDVLKKGRVDLDAPLEPADVVFVPKRLW